jgi:peptidoglycan/xylan/chitin deacetylase (PgdA/CDA1 family)
LLVPAFYATAQQTWKDGKQCTVCLTYDDAINSQLDNVIPQLDKYGFKGTFYIKGSSPVLYHRMTEWKAIASNGHELGNHTLFHACSGKRYPGREKANDLDYYTTVQYLNEVRTTNTLLKALDGKNRRTFAYACGDKTVEGENMSDYLPKLVVAARGGKPEFPSKKEIDLFNMPTFSCTGKTGEKMIDLVKQAMENNGLLILVFHGVGGDYLTVGSDEHEKLLQYLKDNEADIWVAPVVEVADYLNSHN